MEEAGAEVEGEDRLGGGMITPRSSSDERLRSGVERLLCEDGRGTGMSDGREGLVSSLTCGTSGGVVEEGEECACRM